MTTPTIDEVEEHFKEAKEITCLQLGINVSIAYVSKYQYNESNNTYTVIGGVIMVWHPEKGYAKITKKKGCNSIGCNNCKCIK